MPAVSRLFLREQCAVQILVRRVPRDRVVATGVNKAAVQTQPVRVLPD